MIKRVLPAFIVASGLAAPAVAETTGPAPSAQPTTTAAATPDAHPAPEAPAGETDLPVPTDPGVAEPKDRRVEITWR